MAKKTKSEWSYSANKTTRSRVTTIPGTKKKEKRVQYLNKNGQWRDLLNPSQKGRRYSKEVHTKKNVYTGKDLTNTQLAHRSGYLKAREDNAKAYNSRKEKRAAAKEAKKF